MASLIGANGEIHELAKDVIRVGRDSTCDLVIGADPKVSRSHAQVRSMQGTWILLDLESRNGTTVNGHRVVRHPLRDGDRIRIGETLLTYTDGDDANVTEVSSQPGTLPDLDLSARELEVLRCVSEGLTDREIADQLVISISTVRSHLERIRQKTGLRRRSELTRLALEFGSEPTG
jgi:DNA-binding CsgD family transcriptional regulator